jgi:hypothetical protein
MDDKAPPKKMPFRNPKNVSRNDSPVSLFSECIGVPPRNLSLTSAQAGTACNLMLGMIYGNYKGTPEMIANDKGGTPQLRRDTARCLATEIHGKKDVYTLDNRDATDYPSRQGRHIKQDLFKLDLEDPVMKEIKGRVFQVCLDYFWFSGGYWSEKLNGIFFTSSLPELHKLLLPNGCIYLGLSIQMYLGVLTHLGSLEKLFDVSLVHQSEVEEIDLVSGSHLIPHEVYADKQMGEKDQESEIFLGIKPGSVNGYFTGDNKAMLERCRKIANGKNDEECRFIKLEKRRELNE